MILAFLLWKKDNNTNTIKIVCYDINEFKTLYKKFKPITDKDSSYYWTRENFMV
jgi:hypothetical protein